MDEARTGGNDMEMWIVGGWVRDAFLGRPSHDVDLAVEAESFEAIVGHLNAEGFQIWQERPEFGTIRAGVPAGHWLREHTKDADFVWCRVDGPSSDGRRPDWTRPGTLADDLARRDFTVNAMALASDGTLVDPHGGRADLDAGLLRTVGDPLDRFSEDWLRVVRALRFQVTKSLDPDPALAAVLGSAEVAASVAAAVESGSLATERVMDELNRMLAADTLASLELLESFPLLRTALLPRGLTLEATMRQR
jgi:tRNA nucleotidyltransferase (CCA-adding enzyme)